MISISQGATPDHRYHRSLRAEPVFWSVVTCDLSRGQIFITKNLSREEHVCQGSRPAAFCSVFKTGRTEEDSSFVVIAQALLAAMSSVGGGFNRGSAPSFLAQEEDHSCDKFFFPQKTSKTTGIEDKVFTMKSISSTKTISKKTTRGSSPEDLFCDWREDRAEIRRTCYR